jgi:hypothetical protein
LKSRKIYGLKLNPFTKDTLSTEYTVYILTQYWQPVFLDVAMDCERCFVNTKKAQRVQFLYPSTSSFTFFQLSFGGVALVGIQIGKYYKPAKIRYGLCDFILL